MPGRVRQKHRLILPQLIDSWENISRCAPAWSVDGGWRSRSFIVLFVMATVFYCMTPEGVCPAGDFIFAAGATAWKSISGCPENMPAGTDSKGSLPGAWSGLGKLNQWGHEKVIIPIQRACEPGSGRSGKVLISWLAVPRG